jgi:hypothetical protein
MPDRVGAWYDRNGNIYVTVAALRDRLDPFYIVADNWDNPRLTPENWLTYAPDRGYVMIRRSDLVGRSFQIVDRYQRWAPIGETPGICTLKGIICTPGNWLIKPISWTKINWTGFGWKP